ncbi:hypothetical protein [Labedaea rhizosphaerae]|uniref:Uncharacterized protein n=1 Tax=Labedaea rhizosphaerae TaxID=598644 RepID=A0A4R6S5L3_LABRH|nr:hypothetical protein [Labedaea rhizosphaerae]TDP94025.1 hypothetical protein EV186_106419 [Labedaea rhizosphaerae]
MTGEPKPWRLKDSLQAGLVVCFPTAPIILGLAFALGPWYAWILAFPGVILLTVAISLVATVIRGHRAITGPLTAIGLLILAAAGAGLIWFGIMVNLHNAPCDPEVSQCVTVINGVARGESTESTGSQQFGTFLLSLVAILPGLLLLVVSARVTGHLIRRRSSSVDS